MNENKMERNSDNMQPLISIIILNYNAGNLLIDCITSIQKSVYTNYEIILVDNISKDNSHKKCKEKFQKIKLIENKENLGYCEGNNVGIRAAIGEFLVILNPDVIVTSNWLNELVMGYEKHGEGLYQPKILATTNHEIQNSNKPKTKNIIIKNNSWIGASCVILPGVTIGPNIIVGAGSIVTKNFDNCFRESFVFKILCFFS